MEIAIDISPLSTGHSVRGVGFYLKHLKEAMEKNPSGSELVFFEGSKVPLSDVVFYPYFDPFSFSLPFLAKGKRAVTVHDLTPLVFPNLFPSGIKGRLKWLKQRAALRRVDAVLTDSQSSKKDIVRLTGIHHTKVHVVYLAAGMEFRKLDKRSWMLDVRRKYCLPEKFLLYVGDVTPNKNLPRLMEAVMQADVPLVMVGKAITEKDFDRSSPWNKDRMYVGSILERSDKIKALGFVDQEELVAIYNLATVAIVPSLYEGFGLPVLEAMSCGIPVITTKEGSLPEVAGEAAYYVDAYSIESIKNGILEVFGKPDLRKALSKKGLMQVKKFSWEKCAAQTLSVLQSL